MSQHSFKISRKALRNQQMFIFKLKDNEFLIFPLVSGMTFVYNDIFMIHCQEHKRQVDNDWQSFFLIYLHMEMKKYSTT